MKEQKHHTSGKLGNSSDLDNLLDVLADIVIDSFLTKKNTPDDKKQDIVYTTMVDNIKKP